MQMYCYPLIGLFFSYGGSGVWSTNTDWVSSTNVSTRAHVSLAGSGVSSVSVSDQLPTGSVARILGTLNGQDLLYLYQHNLMSDLSGSATSITAW